METFSCRSGPAPYGDDVLLTGAWISDDSPRRATGSMPPPFGGTSSPSAFFRSGTRPLGWAFTAAFLILLDDACGAVSLDLLSVDPLGAITKVEPCGRGRSDACPASLPT